MRLKIILLLAIGTKGRLETDMDGKSMVVFYFLFILDLGQYTTMILNPRLIMETHFWVHAPSRVCGS
jgi:hypothetical protein